VRSGPAEPAPDQFKVVVSLRIVLSPEPRRGASEHESGRHVGLEVSELLLEWNRQ
jgi:hypothetical protein